MVRGIETDSKRYKHKKRNDEKDMCEDMLVWKRYVERDINKLRTRNEKEIDTSVTKKENKTLTPVRVLEILILGVFGPITLITGIYMLFKENYVAGVPLAIIGAIFVISLTLNEKYR